MNLKSLNLNALTDNKVLIIYAGLLNIFIFESTKIFNYFLYLAGDMGFNMIDKTY